MHGWSDKRSEPDSRHPRNCTRGDINKTIKFADSRITFPHRPSSIPPVELYRSTSSSPSLSCPLLFHPCFNPRVVAQVGSGRVCGEPASLLFLMYENLCTLGRKKRRRKRGEEGTCTQPRISTSSTVAAFYLLHFLLCLLDGSPSPSCGFDTPSTPRRESTNGRGGGESGNTVLDSASSRGFKDAAR